MTRYVMILQQLRIQIFDIRLYGNNAQSVGQYIRFFEIIYAHIFILIIRP